MASALQRDDGSWQLLWREPCPSGMTTKSGKPVMVRKTKVVHGLTKKEAIRQANAIEERRRKEGPVPVATKDTLYGYAWSAFMPEEKGRLAIKTYHRQAQLLDGVHPAARRRPLDSPT